MRGEGAVQSVHSPDGEPVEPWGVSRRRPIATVGFSDGAAFAWQRALLAPGFRHCFVALNDGAAWLLHDPLVPRTELVLLPVEPNFDLAAHWRAHGLRAVTVRLAPASRRFWWPAPFTCVEAVKRVIGLRAPFVLTPRQLHDALEKIGRDRNPPIDI
jgi:hypothetical protein